MLQFSMEGHDVMPTHAGGYLVVSVDQQEVRVVSVPSANQVCGYFNDNGASHTDEFEDDNGHGFSMLVSSTSQGVDWRLNVTAADDQMDLQKRIGVEYRSNEF